MCYNNFEAMHVRHGSIITCLAYTLELHRLFSNLALVGPTTLVCKDKLNIIVRIRAIS